MFAVVSASSRQNLVRVGDSITVNRVSAEPESELALEDVVLIADDDGVALGSPAIDGAQVICKVVAHTRGPKVRTQRYKAKKHYERRVGHRQNQTVLMVTAIKAGDASRAEYLEE